MMQALHFGFPDCPLYGVFHPANPPVEPGHGVVMFSSLVREYTRLHHGYRVMAECLAARGFSVLRFDYSGTGDSWGNESDALWSGWVEEGRLAVEELRHASGVQSVSLLGTRLGAWLALDAAAGMEGIEAVLLWDPVHNGEAFFRDLESAGARSAFVFSDAVRDAIVSGDLRSRLEALDPDVRIRWLVSRGEQTVHPERARLELLESDDAADWSGPLSAEVRLRAPRSQKLLIEALGEVAR